MSNLVNQEIIIQVTKRGITRSRMSQKELHHGKAHPETTDGCSPGFLCTASRQLDGPNLALFTALKVKVSP